MTNIMLVTCPVSYMDTAMFKNLYNFVGDAIAKLNCSV